MVPAWIGFLVGSSCFRMRPRTPTFDRPCCVHVRVGRLQATLLRLLVGPIHRGVDCGVKSWLKPAISASQSITHSLIHRHTQFNPSFSLSGIAVTQTSTQYLPTHSECRNIQVYSCCIIRAINTTSYNIKENSTWAGWLERGFLRLTNCLSVQMNICM